MKNCRKTQTDHAPEDGERHPVLDRVQRQVDAVAASSSKACASSSAVTGVWASLGMGSLRQETGQPGRPGPWAPVARVSYWMARIASQSALT